MEDFLAFATSYGLDSDVSDIIRKVSLQDVETGAVVPVGRFHVEN